MLEFACHTWAFNDLTLPEALGTIARLGFRYVDIGSGPNLNTARAAENPTALAEEIRADLDLFNLRLSDLYLLHPRISLADEGKRQKDMELFKALLPFAAALKAPGITLSPGLAHPPEDGEAWDRTVAALREMLKAAAAYKLPVSIEPHMDSMAQTPEQALKLLKEVPGLALTLDWAQFVCQDVSFEAIAALIPQARHLQVRQAARAQLQLPLERGRIDFKKLVKALQAAPYDGVVCIEFMNQPGWHGMETVNPIAEAVKLRDALRDAR
jgi:sugar phosphate isomerase/epimerase